MRSKYQNNVIANYYSNLDSIMLAKLSDLVSQLYLAQTETKKNKLWKRVHKAMLTLKIPPKIINHIMQEADIEILAKNLQDWLSSKPKK